VYRDVLELQRPARKRLRFDHGQLLDDCGTERRNGYGRGRDVRRVDPERRFVLVIEFLIVMIRVVIHKRGVMRLEVTMNDLGVLAALGLGDVHVLGWQQGQAEQAEHGGDGDGATERHCAELSAPLDDAVNSVETLTIGSDNRQSVEAREYLTGGRPRHNEIDREEETCHATTLTSRASVSFDHHSDNPCIRASFQRSG